MKKNMHINCQIRKKDSLHLLIAVVIFFTAFSSANSKDNRDLYNDDSTLIHIVETLALAQIKDVNIDNYICRYVTLDVGGKPDTVRKNFTAEEILLDLKKLNVDVTNIEDYNFAKERIELKEYDSLFKVFEIRYYRFTSKNPKIDRRIFPQARYQIAVTKDLHFYFIGGFGCEDFDQMIQEFFLPINGPDDAEAVFDFFLKTNGRSMLHYYTFLDSTNIAEMKKYKESLELPRMVFKEGCYIKSYDIVRKSLYFEYILIVRPEDGRFGTHLWMF